MSAFMKLLRTLSFLIRIVFLSLAIGVKSVSAPQSVGFYNQFLTTGAVNVDTSTSYNNASSIWNPISYNLSYPSTFVTVTTV